MSDAEAALRHEARVDGIEEFTQVHQLFVLQRPEDLVQDALARRRTGGQRPGALGGEADELGAPVLGIRRPFYESLALQRLDGLGDRPGA